MRSVVSSNIVCTRVRSQNFIMFTCASIRTQGEALTHTCTSSQTYTHCRHRRTDISVTQSLAPSLYNTRVGEQDRFRTEHTRHHHTSRYIIHTCQARNTDMLKQIYSWGEKTYREIPNLALKKLKLKTPGDLLCRIGNLSYASPSGPPPACCIHRYSLVTLLPVSQANVTTGVTAGNVTTGVTSW